MNISIRTSDSITILDLSGRLTLGEGDTSLRQAAQRAALADSRHILLNFDNVASIDSVGIGELVYAHTWLVNNGGELKLCNVPPNIEKILRITSLNTIFEAYSTEDAALRSNWK